MKIEQQTMVVNDMKNPALANYLQNKYQGANLGNSAGASTGGADSYNPFSAGIERGIQSARASLGMTQDQQDKALRSSLLAFGNQIGQMPREKGILNNISSIGRSLSPAISAYDAESSNAMAENNQLANQILNRQAQEQQRLAQEQQRLAQDEDRSWRRDFAERQFAEQKNQHGLLSGLRERQLENQMMKNVTPTEGNVSRGTATAPKATHGRGMVSKEELNHIFNNAEKTITELGDKGHRGLGKRTYNNLLPKSIPTPPLDKDQIKINTLGEVLKGRLYNAWGYRNQAEFEHVPTVSADNPPEVNMAIIEQLKELLLGAEDSQMPMNNNIGDIGDFGNSLEAPETSLDMQGGGQVVPMVNPNTGEAFDIPAELIDQARAQGLVEE